MASVNMENTQVETPLVKEGSSVCALTSDEFPHALGDPCPDFGLMNMDDFLRNVWASEENQAMASAMTPLDGSNCCLATQISLQKQGSLCLPKTSMNMLEEVWKSLQPQQETLASADAEEGQQLRQLTLGEVTLEDFLVKAGIVRESPPCKPSPPSFQSNGGIPGQGNDARYNRSCNRPVGLNALSLVMPPFNIIQQDGPQETLSAVHTPVQQGDWMANPYNKDFSQQQQNETEHILEGSAKVEAAPPSSTPLSPDPDESSAATSNMLTAQIVTPTQRGRKRRTEGSIEKVIQRRQRRMIKNRESAARSRARKQAYTVELEAEVYQLKEENMRLLRMQAYSAELEAEVYLLKEENMKLLRMQEEESELRMRQLLWVLIELCSSYLEVKIERGVWKIEHWVASRYIFVFISLES